MPWKNGGGETVEIARFPDNASIDTFEWRISRARVAARGSFSLFPGVDRTLAVMDGAGIILTFAGRQTVTLDRESSPYTFPGDCAVDAELINGAIYDLNAMSRRGYFRHSMLRMRMSAPCTLQRRGAVTVAIVGSGAIEVRAGRWSESLIAFETLIMNDNSGVRSEIIPHDEAELFVIDLWRY
jgi:environmental stress-induced protein Ves